METLRCAPGPGVAHSPEIDKLAAALVLAQADIKPAPKDSVNPAFKSKYSDLATVWETVKGPLAKHGLAVVQVPGGDGAIVEVTTILLHSSGQWLSGTVGFRVPDSKPHAVGSAITYAKRYALCAMLGVSTDDADDDGNAASGVTAPATTARPAGPSSAGPRSPFPLGGKR